MSWSYVPPVANSFEASAAAAQVFAVGTDQDETNTVVANETHDQPDLSPLDLSTSDGKVKHIERLIHRHDTYGALTYALTVEGLDLDILEYVRELAAQAFDDLKPSLSETEKKQLSYALAAHEYDNELDYSAPTLALSA